VRPWRLWRPVLITSFTASSLYSGVNPRRVRPMMDILSYEVSTERGQGHPGRHGRKAPFTNAQSARPATWPSNGALTAHGPANASALEVSAPAARR
jgi:hypothetical protein